MEKIKVTITDDKRDIRDGVELMLNQAEDIECIGSYEDGKSSIEGNSLLNPDIALMDIGLPDISGIECVRTLKQRFPAMDFIMLTVKTDDESVFKSLKAGACGYLTKNLFQSRLLNAIREAKAGGAPMSSSIARLVVTSFNSITNPDYDLTEREREVLTLLCQGKSYKVIAETLFISSNTVNYHLKNIYAKLHVNSKAEAMVKASGEGII
jgi:DNA-binding NarL/FixJ family response regulator